ncbi:MAG: Pr6Pr family membrane protein [Bacteroidales bacterium]|nr:Pr6Pr family membrane protein [Bacteroidales bacterium]
MNTDARKYYSSLGAIIAWTTVITQFVLLIQNTKVAEFETIVRFFSYFTILTNTLVAVYFTAITFSNPVQKTFYQKPGFLTAVSLYITVVGLVYQIVLRPLWSPTGLQFIVDETLHSVIPVMTIIFWIFYEEKETVRYKMIPGWLIFPLVYFFLVLIRGSISGFYPYPFVNMDQLGIERVIVNAVMLLLLFIVLGAAFIWIGKLIVKRT